MTVSATTTKSIGYGNGAATEWPFTYRVFQASDVEVIVADADGIETILNPVSYNVVLNAGNVGGKVVYPLAGSPLAVGYTIVTRRKTAQLQGARIGNQGSFYPAVHEAAFDRVTMIVQELQEQLNRAVKVDISSGDDPALILDALAQAVVDAAASASASAASQALAADYAAKVNGFASGTDNSAKAWAIGGTGSGQPVAGPAKDWASKTGGSVDGAEYSAKEYATGATVPTGSAKDWAVKTGSAVVGAAWSAMEWAVGTAMRGVAGLGSAKDWAIYTGGTVDGTGYSAKKHATDAATSAAAAAASAAGINLPSAAGHGTNYLRQKATEDGFEYRTPSQVLADIGAPTTATVKAMVQPAIDAAVSAIILADINGSNAAGVYGRVAVDDFESETLGDSASYDSANKRYKTKNYTARQTAATGVNYTNMYGTTPTVATLTDGNIGASQGYTTNGSGSRLAMLFGASYTFGRMRFYNYANNARVRHFKVVYTTDGGTNWNDATITAWAANCSQYNSTQGTATNANGWVDVYFATPSNANGVGVYVIDVYNVGADYNAGINEMEVYSVTTVNPTWTTQAFSLAARPTDVHAYLVLKDNVSVTNGVDRTIECSIDNGVTWAAAGSYTDIGAAGSDKVVRASFDVSAQNGTSLKLRVKGLNSKDWEWAEHADYAA